MRAWKPVRILLILILIAGVTAIWWSFHSRRGQPLSGNRTELLPDDLARRATSFEYSEYRRGQTVFRVWAETSVETLLGEHALTDVGLSFFDEEGNPSDSIRGKKAIYNTEAKKIEFSGEVEIGLSDGTRVFTDQLAADLNAETIQIEDDFRFAREQASGTGQGLVYHLPDRLIKISRGFRLEAADDSGPLQVQAGAFEHTLGGDTVALTGSARVRQGERALQAEQIQLELDPQDRMESILASGDARLFPSAGETFYGRQIRMTFQPAGQLSGFQIDGAPQGQTASRAVYEGTAQGRRNRVESVRMTVGGRAAENGSGVQIDSFEARGDVLFTSGSAGLDELQSDLLTARFSPEQQLQVLDFTGNVRGRRESVEAGKESLLAESLQVFMGPGQTVDRSIARGNVQLDQSAAGLNRRLRAREAVEVNYQEGVVSQIISRGDSRLELREGMESQTDAWAPEIQVLFSDGKTDTVAASGGVRWRQQDAGTVRDSTSQTLLITYKDGVMQEAVQAGDFRFSHQGTSGRVNLQAARAVYRLGEGTVTAESPGDLANLRYLGRGDQPEQALVTFAGRFILQQDADKITALQKVRSIRNQNGDALVVNAGRMDADLASGWVWYSGQPTIVQQRGMIAGQRVGFNSQEREVIVEGQVRSRLGAEGQAERYRVQSDRLTYGGDSARARYEGEVVLESEDLKLEAPFVELIFESQDQSRLREVTAWGGVRIEQQGNRATGERAVYYPEGERIVLTGAEAAEPHGGQATPRADQTPEESKKEARKQ
jgi:LPS export ABC transporter protein LptC